MTDITKLPSRSQRGETKLSKIPIKVKSVPKLPKPEWIKVPAPSGARVLELKKLLRDSELNTVCEQASCPNLGECFSNGTATFMAMGNFCTRRCPFCDVAHGRPDALDPDEPARIAEAAALMRLKYVVVTSVDRDDLLDGGAGHFAQCVSAIRARVNGIRIEILVPDFRGRMERAMNGLLIALPDVFNHNMETVRSLYKSVRPGSDYDWSLSIINEFKRLAPSVLTKSGLMLGLGESLKEIKQCLTDLKGHGCDMVTLGQYLQPSKYHLPVTRYVKPEEFKELEEFAKSLGFVNVASGPLVRSSYHADEQAKSN
tara:strand:+ start:2390 stop:3331 length:942 start_codon:yes stop_codon:yes gene_type:complete